MRLLFFVIFSLFFVVSSANGYAGTLQEVLQENQKIVEHASRKTVDTVIEKLLEIKDPSVPEFLANWRSKKVWMRKSDGLFVYVKKSGDVFELADLESNLAISKAEKSGLKQLKPNAGVRGVIAGALVRFQLSDTDVQVRLRSLQSIERSPKGSYLAPLRASISDEPDAEVRKRKQRIERLLTLSFAKDEADRLAAIESFDSDLGLDVRGALNKLLATKQVATKGLPENQNIKRRLNVGSDITLNEAYDFLVGNQLMPKRLSSKQRDAALIANISGGKVAGLPTVSLNTEIQRDFAYSKLVASGLVKKGVIQSNMELALKQFQINEVYLEKSAAITAAAEKSLAKINNLVGFNQLADLALDGLSLASIYFLAAIGLAITFGVMGVINMAHGEFIMMGAYTGYVVQQFISDYTVSIFLAVPLAFVVTFLAGVILERLVIRHLMHRPLETLLATFGISIALQQIAKNIFGTQARPLTSPDWLDGAWVLNDVVSISYIRIAIFVLALGFLFLLLFILNRTRLGLEVRAVTQNPRMAASMGINPDKVNMLTFGLGSGVAGIAGVAIGLFAKVTSELGSGYIVQSFMTVVVGGVGSIWGTLAGAGMIGSLQKIIEWFNPSNTLAAQTYMIIFIIIFIQFRPKGLIALKGRAAGD